jgi:hypothetical protein
LASSGQFLQVPAGSKIYAKFSIGEEEGCKQQIAVGKFVERVKENGTKSSGKFQ